MNVQKLTDEEIIRLKGILITKIKEKYDRMKGIFSELKSKYSQEYEDIKKENNLLSEEIQNFSKDLQEFKNLNYSLRNSSHHAEYSHEELKIIKYLFDYEDNLIKLANHLREINKRLGDSIAYLNENADHFINIVNALDSSHNEDEFVRRLEILNDVKKKVVNSAKEIINNKKELLHKKEKIDKLVKHIIDKKHHYLKKLNKDLHKDENSEEKAKKEEQAAITG